MRTVAIALIAAALIGIAPMRKPVPVDPKNPCNPMPTQMVCIEGHCFFRVLPCNRNA